ncbi:MAG: glycoside hydrolase family 5 protein [Flavobacteriaceae bacterium]|nr:glycoside hydrolase family 5 protein [Flavobacteriaceae bacterium]
MNFKSKIIILLLAFSCSVANAQFVKNHGQLSVKGTQLVDKNGEAIVLRGLSFGWHNWWGKFYNKDVVKTLHNDWNATVLRAAMGVDADENCYIQKPNESKAKIKAVIKAAIDQDIYVIIDFHSHNIHLKEAKVFFDEMSKKYAKYPNIIYEVFNEPNDESWEEVKAYSQEVIQVIRANDPKNIILVGSPHWDQDIHLPAKDPILGFNNLMYTMHFYAGTHGKWLRDRTDEAIKSGLPIFVSESAGMEATGDGPLNLIAWQEYIDWMEKNKISWITWSVSSKVETCSFLKENANSNGKWKDSDIQESGLKTREYLRKYNAKQ